MPRTHTLALAVHTHTRAINRREWRESERERARDEAENTYITRRIGRSTGDALSGCCGRDRPRPGGRSLKSTPGEEEGTFWLRWTTTTTTVTIYGEEERVDED